jgi:hypothetical protein
VPSHSPSGALASCRQGRLRPVSWVVVWGHLPHRPRLGRPIPRTRSPSCADNSGSANPWAGSAHASTSRRRGVLLKPGVGSLVATRPHDHRPVPSRCAGLVLGVLQPRPPAQLSSHDEPDQLREHRGTQPRSRIEKPSTIRGNHNLSVRVGRPDRSERCVGWVLRRLRGCGGWFRAGCRFGT